MAAGGGEGGEKDENAKLALAFMSNICCFVRPRSTPPAIVHMFLCSCV